MTKFILIIITFLSFISNIYAKEQKQTTRKPAELLLFEEFKNLDSNKDGLLTKWEYYVQIKKRYDSLNNDGKRNISKTEFINFYKQHYNDLRNAFLNNPSLSKNNKNIAQITDAAILNYFQSFSLNKKGLIVKWKYYKQELKNFKLMDTNKDKKITIREHKIFMLNLFKIDPNGNNLTK